MSKMQITPMRSWVRCISQGGDDDLSDALEEVTQELEDLGGVVQGISHAVSPDGDMLIYSAVVWGVHPVPEEERDATG